MAGELRYTGEVLDQTRRLAAPVEPRVVVGIAHNKALRVHVLPIQAWLKSPRSVVGPESPIVARRGAGPVNVEGELAVVVGRRARGLSVGNALDAVLGYTIANDVTNVGRVAIDERNFEAKSGEGYTPIGPWIETDLTDPDAVPIVVCVNGEVRAESSTALLQSTVAECLAYVSAWVELGPGDVVLTGAPGTFLPVEPGDVVRIELPGIGSLTNPVT